MARDWVYHATVRRVIDGDTIVVDLDMGMRVWQLDVHVRLAGINAPELRSPEGKTSRDYLRGIIGDGPALIVSHSFEKYGRLLATVYVERNERIDVNQAMVDGGHAVRL